MVRNGAPVSGFEGARWRKSSRSGAVGNCVELAAVTGGMTAVRDSKAPQGGVLVFPGSARDLFLAFAR